MSGRDERTIAPSPRRIAEARRAGDVPHSQQLTAAVATFAGIAVLCILANDLCQALTELLHAAWSAPVVRIDGSGAPSAAVDAVQRIALLLAVILGVPAIAAVLATGIQRGFRFQIRFRGSGWRQLNPRAGVQRFRSAAGLGFAGGLTLSVTVAFLVTGWMLGRSGPAMSGRDAEATAAAIGRSLMSCGLLLGGAFLLLGVGDWVVRRRRFWRSLRMTMAEAREEARAAKSPRRSRTRRQSRVSVKDASVSTARTHEEPAMLAAAKPLLPSDPLIS